MQFKRTYKAMSVSCGPLLTMWQRAGLDGSPLAGHSPRSHRDLQESLPYLGGKA